MTLTGEASTHRETLIDILRVGGRDRGDKPALVSLDRTVTYAEIADESARLAKALVDRGVRPGDRVGYLVRSSTHFVSILFSSAIAGSVLRSPSGS